MIAQAAFGQQAPAIPDYPTWASLSPEEQERWRCAAQDIEVLFSANRPWQDYVPAWLNVTPDSLARWQAAASAVEQQTPDMNNSAQGLT
jgi:hypothetical protein